MKFLILLIVLALAGVAAFSIQAPSSTATGEGVVVLSGAPLLRTSVVTPAATTSPSSEPDTAGGGTDTPVNEPVMAAMDPPATIPNETIPAAPVPASSSVSHPPSVDEPRAVTEEDGVLRLTFRVLGGFEYELPDPMHADRGGSSQIPEVIRGYDGKRVKLEGYMVPLVSRGNRVTLFYLARDVFGCCFGDMPRINEMVEVKTTDPEGVPISSGIPVLVTGTFEVGEEKDEFGYVNSIYRLAAEDVTEQW